MSEETNLTATQPAVNSNELLDARTSPERGAWTPEQRADAIIQVVYADTPPPLWFELRDTIAAEIREAVKVERWIRARNPEGV